MIVAHISDTHLGVDARLTIENWNVFRRHAEKQRPRFVVNTGDVVLDDPDDPWDRQYAASLHAELPGEVQPASGHTGQP